MLNHAVVNHQTWLEARRELLRKEKEFTRLRDELSAQRQALPWTPVEKPYSFEDAGGRVTLGDLFEGRSQLLIYHFMFDPNWDEGCKSCSFLADHYDPSIVHLHQRDVSFVTVSRAPLAKLQAFQKRMGWRFRWVSSFGTDFNRDFGVTFTQQEMESGAVDYNFGSGGFPVAEAPGLSAFYRDAEGAIFRTYSTYARGLDIFIGAYNFLDVTPRGRDEGDLPYGMAWVRHHDAYANAAFADPFVALIKPAKAASGATDGPAKK